jgi:hypothetical protein
MVLGKRASKAPNKSTKQWPAGGGYGNMMQVQKFILISFAVLTKDTVLTSDREKIFVFISCLIGDFCQAKMAVQATFYRPCF